MPGGWDAGRLQQATLYESARVRRYDSNAECEVRNAELLRTALQLEG